MEEFLVMRIAYFSWKGHTEKVATALASLLDAELVRIEPLRESGMAGKLLKTLFVMKSAIKPCPTDLTGIDGLIIATPVWASKVPPYVNEYLARVSGGEGKPFHVIAEMGGRGSEGTIAAVRKRAGKERDAICLVGNNDRKRCGQRYIHGNGGGFRCRDTQEVKGPIGYPVNPGGSIQ